MSVRARGWGWRRLLPVLCVLAIGVQLGPLTEAQEPTLEADLSLVKTDRVDPVTVGDEIIYDLRFHNDGPDDAVDMQIVDTLPDEVEFVSGQASHNGRCTYTAADRTVTCAGFQDIPDDNSQGVAHITVKAIADGNPTNTATVSSDSFDVDSTNNSDSETTQINPLPPSADLSVSKTGPTSANNGENFTYGLTVTNAGPDTASSVSLSDTLPSNVSFVSASAGCTPSGATVTCALGDVATGSVSRSITVIATSVGTANNTASVTSSTPDPVANNTSNTVQTVIGPSADVSISKTGPENVKNGETFNYSLTVSNAGPDPAADVIVTDPLPGGVQFVSASPGCSNATGPVVCSLGTVAPGSQILTITVKATSAGTKTNTASVETDTHDPNPNNNTSASINTEAGPVADVSISKTGPASSPRAGQPFTYQLTVANAGPDKAVNVVATDDLPDGLTVSSEGDCDETSTGVLTCTSAEIASGSSATFSFQVVADTAGTYTNTATVQSGTFDPDDADHSSSTSTTVTQRIADLSITKDGPAAAETGDSLTYTLNVANAGPDAAEAVTVTDTLPGSLSFGSSSDCTHLNGTITCAMGTIANGGTDSATFTATATQAGTIQNTASVTSSTSDPNGDNNSGSDSTTVTDPPPPPDANVSIGTTDSADPVTEGDTYSYTITITNAGPDSAENVQLVDTLPSGLSAGTLPAGCSVSGSVVTCAVGSVGASPVDVTIPVVANTPGAKSNLAEVSWNASGGSTETVSDTETTTVNEKPIAEPPPAPSQEPQSEGTIDGCPTAARSTSGLPSDGLLALVPGAIQLERQRRRKLSLADDGPSAAKGGKRSRSKVIKIVAAIAVVAVAAVVGVLLLTGGDKGKNFATLGGIEGRVDLQKTGESFERAKQAATLNIGDKVRTGDDGYARIDYTDGSLTRLDHNTTFQVQELINDETHKSIRTKLDVGRVMHRVEKLTKQEDRFEVKTVTAVATVQGTIMSEDCRALFNGDCNHVTFEGLVDVIGNLGDKESIPGGQCRTEEDSEIGECQLSDEEIANDSFYKQVLEELAAGIDLSKLFGKSVALVPIEEEPQVQAVQATPTTSPTTTPTEEPACPTGQNASRGTSLPLSAAIALMVIFFGIAWARPNRKSGPAADSAN